MRRDALEREIRESESESERESERERERERERKGGGSFIRDELKSLVRTCRSGLRRDEALDSAKVRG